MGNGKNFVVTEQNVNIYVQRIANWIRTKMEEANRKGLVLGMSGGVDCSVVARICQVANVPIHLVLMPYDANTKNANSQIHAMELVKKFGFTYHIFDIKPVVDALTISMQEEFSSASSDANHTLANANIRPRIRMTYLYQFAQLNNYFVVGTGNMSERTVGYFTKWGDGACDINPLGFLTKAEVYIIAKFLEIPYSIIDKKPSADLWENQTDEEELGMSYLQIDNYILKGTSGSSAIDDLIKHRSMLSKHKLEEIPVFKG